MSDSGIILWFYKVKSQVQYDFLVDIRTPEANYYMVCWYSSVKIHFVATLVIHTSPHLSHGYFKSRHSQKNKSGGRFWVWIACGIRCGGNQGRETLSSCFPIPYPWTDVWCIHYTFQNAVLQHYLLKTN